VQSGTKGGAHVFADTPAEQRTEYSSDKLPFQLSYSVVGREMSVSMCEDGEALCTLHIRIQHKKSCIWPLDLRFHMHISIWLFFLCLCDDSDEHSVKSGCFRDQINKNAVATED
jgi:hypothetical protein